MNRASYTLLLAGALSACTKPNPLFLDTAGGVSEGGSQADTGTSGGVDTATATTTGVEPTTSAGSGTTGLATSDAPTSSSTGMVEPCSQKAEVVLIEEDQEVFTLDTFMIREIPTLGCSLVDPPAPPDCILRNWGATDYFWLSMVPAPNDGFSFLALRFDRDTALQKLAANGYEVSQIHSVSLRLTFLHEMSLETGQETVFEVRPFGDYPADNAWPEGFGWADPGFVGMGATWACRTWSGMSCVPWNPDSDIQNKIDGPTYALKDGVLGTFTTKFDPQAPDPHMILKMAPAGGVTNEQLIAAFLGDLADPTSFGRGVLVKPAALLQKETIGVKATEVGEPSYRPALVVEVCLN